MHKIVPAPSLSLSRPDPRSSGCPFASSARSSRVAAPVPRATTLAKVASISDGPLGAEAPRFVDIPPSGVHLIVERPGPETGGYEVRSVAGVLVAARSASTRGSHLLARDDLFHVDGRTVAWDAGASRPYFAALNPGGELLAIHMREGLVRALLTSPGAGRNHGPPDSDYTQAFADHVLLGGAAPGENWSFRAEGPGVGAIDGNGVTVIALQAGRLLVLSPRGTQEGEGVLHVDMPIDPGATDLSLVPSYAMLLYGGGDAGELVARRDASAASSRLDARTVDGALAWRASLPFLAAQPPLDGGDRVYVVGAGIAALGLDGRPLWSTASRAPFRAAAFVDGTLALVRGDELQIVGRDGTIRQSFRTGEELTSYPAIASDGAVWVASRTTLYVAN